VPHAAEVDGSEQEEQQDGQDDGELHQRLAALGHMERAHDSP
jgi:hypothetical protein